MQTVRPQAYLHTAVETVRKTSRFLVQNMDRIDRLHCDTSQRFHVVTNLDRQIEQRMIECIRERYPEHTIIGKHSGKHKLTDSDFTWVVDPLSGTVNYISGIPHFCSSLAIYYQGTALASVVYQPVTDELYTAIAGNSAKRNDRRIRSNLYQTDAKPALALIENTSTWPKSIQPSGLGIRSMGCSVLSLCYVATGQADLAYLKHVHSSELAAAEVLAREAKVVLKKSDLKDGMFESVIAIGHDRYSDLNLP